MKEKKQFERCVNIVKIIGNQQELLSHVRWIYESGMDMLKSKENVKPQRCARLRPMVEGIKYFCYPKYNEGRA